MNKILVVLLIVQAALAVTSNELRSKKLAREGTIRKSNVEYIKTNNLRLSMEEGVHEFFEGEFSTRIDHFRPLNQQRVNFTYNANTHHFENYGPLYIYLKDAFDYSTDMIEEGLMVDIARETGAALLTFDPRYFGLNRPFDSASFENLELLSVEQAIADTAEFIRVIRREIPTAEFSRVILWGSGVGGTLAVFARSRYAHLIHAAWSSSGIFDSGVYSYGPYDVLEFTFDIDDGGVCRETIQDAYEEIVGLVLSGQGAELADRLNLCNPVETDNPSDVAALYENSIRAVMYYFEDFHHQGVLDFCEDMQAVEGEPLESLARWFRYVYGDEECFDPSYASSVERYSNPAWDEWGTSTGRRQWYFLQCTQIGSFLLADNNTWLPGTVDLEYHLQKCEDVFGVEFTYETIADAFYTLRDEFSLRIPNALYTNGNIDPLRYFGRVSDPTNEGIVINIDFASKSADLTSIDADEPDAFTRAKERIIDVVTRWSSEVPPTEPPVTPTSQP
ncbi:lysosomal Pro-X carboxypeptidase-like [Bradysia coprophila]|uniref:lysosomal Pro-X carboxypeptidase-like n=1 Tax=Bradysia coprophila TaxID=38358 RepID=UPI00187DD04A|nr:lysosomal Pro-X carboxypeptidase-like [Bradysia coprophila]